MRESESQQHSNVSVCVCAYVGSVLSCVCSFGFCGCVHTRYMCVWVDVMVALLLDSDDCCCCYCREFCHRAGFGDAAEQRSLTAA